MLCKTSKVTHPGSGVTLETPLLVPSFSSKAFGFAPDGKPEVNRVLSVAREFIQNTHPKKTCLVSAYDIHYGYIPKPPDIIAADLMFLDSGGYEISDDHDLSTIDMPIHRPSKWDVEKLWAIWNQWPDYLPTALVCYDDPHCRKSVAEQLRDAKQAALDNPGHLHSFLLKPETQQERCLKSALIALRSQIEKLIPFQFLGVTEKELGNSPLERMLRIATLRRALDDASMNIPIHIFGALDPLSVCLYFTAGAEVFDGLTWSRYAYSAGQCVYVHNNAIMAYGVEIDHDEMRVRTIKDNLHYLSQLEKSLLQLAKTGDWIHLIDNRDLVQSVTEKMMHHLREIE